MFEVLTELGGPRTPSRDSGEADVCGDGVQPGAELRAWLVAVGALPRAQHRLLERVVGVVERAEHSVTVEMERPPVWLDQERERLLVHRLRDATRPAGWADPHRAPSTRRAGRRGVSRRAPRNGCRPGPDGIRCVAIGGSPGAFTPGAWTEL